MSDRNHGAGDREQRERLLDGAAPVDTPLARLLAAAQRPADPGELDGLTTALAGFTGADGLATASPGAGPNPRRRWRVFTAFAAAGLTTQIGIGVAAAAGVAGLVVVTVAPSHHRPPGTPVPPTGAPSQARSDSSGPDARRSGTAPAVPKTPTPSTISLPGTSGSTRSHSTSPTPTTPVPPSIPLTPTTDPAPTTTASHPGRRTSTARPTPPTKPAG